MPLNISPELLKTYQEEISKRSSSATLKRKRASLSKFFNWAEGEGHIEENPISQIEPMSVVTNATKDIKRYQTPVLAFISLALGIIAIILALKNVKLPIPSKKSSAQNQTITQVSPEVQTPQVLSAGPWTIFTKLSLSDSSGSPITASQTITFKLYKNSGDTSPVWTSSPMQETPDASGRISISLDGVPSDVFFQNDRLFLGGTTSDINGNSQTLPSMPVSTANTASNLQGFAPASPETGATPNTIPVISSDGSLILASESPAIKATNGNLLIEGQVVTINAPGGETNILSNLKIQDANLKSGSLISGYVGNNLSNYDLIHLSSGSSPTEKFSVDAQGNTFIAGDATISGQLGINNLSVNKKGTALNDLVTLTLDERNKPTDRNSIYSTLVLKRYDGAREAAALYVDEGNAIFDGQLQLGRYTSNPTAIGQGSLVFNTADLSVYYWNGSSWVSVGTASTVPFSGIASGTNTQAAMVVGSGATLGYTGTGTINASSLIGATWAAPGTIGSTTANSGAFTTLTSSGNSTIGTGASSINTIGSTTTPGALTLHGATTLDNTLTVSGANLTSLGGNLKLIGGDILDTNGNEFLRFTSAASAVNEITLANAATGGGVTLAATGGDAAIALSIDAKGTGAFNLNNTATGDVLIAGGSGSTGCTITNSNGNLACAGTITASGGITASSIPFSGITSATNTQAAMVVGTGASLNYTGTGTINASSLIGATWAAPGTIGSGTPNTGAFTTLTSSGNSTIGTGASSINTIGSTTTPGDLTLHGATTLDNAFSQTGANTFGTGTGAVSLNGDTTIAANKNLTLAAGTGSLVLNSSLSDASDQVIDISPAFAGGATDLLTYTVIDLAAFSPTNAAGTDTVNGIEIGALTDPGATITSTALKIGSGWDNVLTVNGTTVINATGQVPTTQLTGTLVSTSADSGSSTLIQGDSLAISGGTNGVDTVLSGDTYTLNLDTAEVGTTTWGAGSGFTWTFDAGAVDPTLALASDLVTITAATTTLSGDLELTGADITTTSTGTATVFNTNATTLNMGGAATTVSIGAATGTTTINNGLIVNGVITFNTDVDMSFAETENFTVTGTATGANSVDLISASLANNTSSGNQRILVLTNSGSGTTENGILITNSGTGTTALEISGTWGTGIITSNNSINAGTGSITSGAITSSGLLTVSTGGATITGDLSLDGDISFVGAQKITTTTGNLTLDSSGTLVISDVTDLNNTLDIDSSSLTALTVGDGTNDTLIVDTSGDVVNIQNGGLQTGGVSRLTNAGLLENITGYAQASGTFSLASAQATGTVMGITENSLTTGTGFSLGSSSLTTGILASLSATSNLTNDTGTQTTILASLSPTQASTGVGGTHELYGIYIQNLAASGTPSGTNTEYGIRVGTGYDYAAYFESPVYFTNTLTQSGSSQVTLTGNVDASSGLDVTNSALTTGAGLTVSGGATSISGTSVTINPATGFTAAVNFNSNTTLGDASSDTITFTGVQASNLLPSADAAVNLGSASFRYNYVYTANLIADQTIIPNTAANSFVINSDNATTDLEDSQLEYERGTIVPNAIIKWDSTNDEFNFNFPITAITTETNQLKLGYDTSNYLTINIANNGAVTLDAVGTGAGFSFSDGVTVSSGGLTVTTGVLSVSAGGASITGGLNNNSGGITNAGAISGATTGGFSGALTAASLDAGSGAIATTGTVSGGTVNATTGVNTGASGGTQRIDSSGNLVNIGNVTLTGSTNLQTNTAVTNTLTINNSGSGSLDVNLSDGSLATAGTTRLTNGGALQNITGLTVASGGAGITGGLSSDTLTLSSTATFNGSATFNTDVDLTLADTENLALTNTVTGTNNLDLISASLTNNTASGTQRGLVFNFAGSGVTDAGLILTNSGDQTATTGIEIAGTWGTGLFTNNNSINAGTGSITGGAGTFSSLNLIGSQTITSTTAPQLSVRYDASNRWDSSVSATGGVTFDAVGTGAQFSFSDSIDIAGSASTSGTLSFRGTTDPKINVLNGENFGIRTSVGGDVGLTENLTILNSGNVGIGTTGPDAKLDSLATTEQLRLTYTDGTVYSSFTTDSSGNLTIDNTGTKTIIADDFQINGADILDTNGNEFLRFTSNASAVNEITMANAATGGGVTLAATGGDAAIALSIDAKGTGALNLNNTATGDVLIAGGSGSTGCSITNATGALACAGAVTGSNLSGTNTGDQFIFQTISTTSGTSPVADTTTDTLTLTAGTGITITGDSATDTVTIASTGVASSLPWSGLTAPTANLSLTHAGYTTAFTFDSVTTADAFALSSTSLTTGTLFDLSSTSTAGGVSGSSKILDITRSGTNTNASHTAYGLYSAVTNTGTTSTNIGGYFSASGATNNYAAIFESGNVGIGTTGPESPLHLVANNFIQEFASDNQGIKPTWYTKRARGTIASKSAVSDGDDLMLFETTGWSGTGYLAATRIYSEVDGAVTTTSVPGKITFATVPAGSGSSVERMVIRGDGNVGIGTTGPVAKLDIVGSQNFTAFTAPGALTAGTPTAGGSCTAGTHSYKVTFTSVGSGETTAGTVSSVITCVLTTGQTVPLSAIPTGPAGTIARKIYRTVAGDTGSYLLLTTLSDNTTTTFSDTVADGSLGTAAPVSNTTAVANLQTGGTTRMVIDNSGNVGIGTTGPSYPFHVEKSSAGLVSYVNQLGQGTAFQSSTASTANSAVLAYTNALHAGTAITDSAVLQVISDNPSATGQVLGIRNDGSGISLYVDTNGAGYSAIFDGGNVGIGTTTPGTKLDVNGMITISGGEAITYGLKALRLPTGISTIDAGLSIRTVAGESIVQFGNNYFSGYTGTVDTTKAGVMIRLDTRNGTGGTTYGGNSYTLFQIQTRGAGEADGTNAVPFQLMDAPTGSFIMDSEGDIGLGGLPGTAKLYVNGNVGIGTASPGVKLEIAATGSDIVGGNAINGSTMQGIKLTNSLNNDSSVGLWFGTVGSHWSGISGQRSSYAVDWGTDLRFYTHEGATVDLTYARERMRIDKSGNVGIGTTGPGALLQINQTLAGTAGSRGVLSLQGYGATDTTNGYISFYESGGARRAYLGETGNGNLVIGVDSGNIQMNGNVGIGTTSPQGKLDVNGTAYSTSGTWTGSDVRWKQNVEPIVGALGKILQLQGITYTWNKTDYPTLGFSDGTQMGLIAQQIESFVPEVVSTRGDGFKSVEYGNLAALLIEGIKEQQGQIASLSGQLASLLQIAGSCVTGDTLLPIRRRRRKNSNGLESDEWDYFLCRIDEILLDDEVLSLNEFTGSLEWHRINALKDMDIREVYELTTKSGRVIRTTANHPYLTLTTNG